VQCHHCSVIESLFTISVHHPLLARAESPGAAVESDLILIAVIAIGKTLTEVYRPNLWHVSTVKPQFCGQSCAFILYFFGGIISKSILSHQTCQPAFLVGFDCCRWECGDWAYQAEHELDLRHTLADGMDVDGLHVEVAAVDENQRHEVPVYK
jgi:hypothetical protein